MPRRHVVVQLQEYCGKEWHAPALYEVKEVLTTDAFTPHGVYRTILLPGDGVLPAHVQVDSDLARVFGLEPEPIDDISLPLLI